jgi:hypothetical protein
VSEKTLAFLRDSSDQNKGDKVPSGKMVNVDFLRTASMISLQEYELSRRNAAANLARQLRVLLNQIVEELVEADLARMMIEHRSVLKEAELSEDDPFLLVE